MARKLVILYDGTWNTVKDQTNVSRLAQLLAGRAPDGSEQHPWYDAGVGTHALDRALGGITGLGLSHNIRQSFGWLAEHYLPGDEIWLFGFSRGAYTARSLAGLIRKCGILRLPDPGLVQQAYEIYRNKNIHPDNPEAVQFRASFARETRIRFIGVWDTVGSLGVPATGIPFGRDYFTWHDTELSKIVDYAYHALAVDENRKDFAPAVWTARKPENLDVEQRWFVGSHSNVGGGYRNDPLPIAALTWLQRKAKAAGLGFKQDLEPGPEDHLAPINDSYSEFAFGLYKRLKGGKRYYRVFGRGVNETIDDSVWKRWQAQTGYRPPTVAAQHG
jgi:uncharacterized protein (DUF2235 family)